jgi:hypothetical protein
LERTQKPNRRALTAKHPSKAAEYNEEVIEKSSNVIYNASRSATPEDKPQIKYPGYPWEAKEQIKGGGGNKTWKELADESTF